MAYESSIDGCRSPRKHALRFGGTPLAILGAFLLTGFAPVGPASPSAPVTAQDAENSFDGLVFRSHFAINLHHFLYLQGVAARNSGRIGEAPEAWMRAVEFYRSTMIERDLLFDPGMRRIDQLLSTVQSVEEIGALELPAGLAPVLVEAAPLYRERFWPEHELGNRRWLTALTPLLQEHGPKVVDRLCGLFEAEWPEEVAVDLLVYANWAGAYTSDDPDHIRIATRFPRIEEPHEAFETIFHEASHLLIGKISTGIDRIARETGDAPPRDLWHAVMFFTVGEVARQSGATPEGYVPYAERHGLYERSPAWGVAREAMREHWTPYLEGKASLDEALRKVVAAFPATEPPGD